MKASRNFLSFARGGVPAVAEAYAAGPGAAGVELFSQDA